MFPLGLASGVSGDRLHGLSALRLALLSCSRDVIHMSVLMRMRVPVPFCHRVRGFEATDILALLEFQDPVSGVACVRLGPRFRGLWRKTTWPLCTSARFAVRVAFTVINTYGVCPRVSGANCTAYLHFRSLCCRAREMSLNGYLRSD